jgi:two-component system, NtrC family, response regulator AtoC
MERRKSVLVVEDDPVIRHYLEITFQEPNTQITSVSDGQTAVDVINKRDFDLVFTDLKIPKLNGIQVLRHIKEKKPHIDVVIGTAYGTIDNAVEAMRLGASDYLTKPFQKQDIKNVLKKLLSDDVDLNVPNADVEKKIDSIMLGDSDGVKRIKRTIKKIAHTKATVLIEGETGSGKEIVADAIHYSSQRRDRPYIKVNCASFPDTLIESELFGYEKGAFTGAHISRKGRFENANTGTILLDEISEQGIASQAKLLRVIQSKQVERLGNGKPLDVDTRIIATSNRDLLAEIKAERFRKDLYFRLNVVKIRVPALRERKADIPILVDHFIDKVHDDYGIPRKVFSTDAINKMLEYDWPGNVRELENTIEKTMLTSDREKIRPEDLTFADEFGLLFDFLFGDEKELTIHEAEKRLVLNSLNRFSNNKTQAASSLGITVKTLRNKLKLYNQRSWEENSQAA